MKQYSEHVLFIYALFGKTVPKKPSSSVWGRIQKRMRRLLGRKSPTANVESALAKASKLTLTISKSFNISQGPQLADEKRSQLKGIIVSFLNNGRRISECTSRPMRRKKELIRALLRKTIEEWNRCLVEINGNWLQGYGHIYHDRGKPEQLDKTSAISLFNEFIDCHLISCKEMCESARAIKIVFTSTSTGESACKRGSDKHSRACSFKLSNES